MRHTSSSFAVLRNINFRRIWTTSIFAHLGNWILTVTAAWSMTKMTNDPAMIALVQTAIFAPYLFFGLIAGTLADIFNRRIIIIIALCFRMLLAALLAVLSNMDMLSPTALLSLCFLFGVGGIGFAPAWQTSISEQVAPDEIPHAIALNSISFNIARSSGPAIGGIILAAAGTFAAFLTTVVSIVPVLIAFLLWKPKKNITSLPRERFWDGISACVRYITHTPSLRNTLIRTFVLGVAGGIFAAFAPLVATETLSGGANIYGILLTALGVGAVIGALLSAKFRTIIKPENILAMATIGCATSAVTIAISSSLMIILAAYFVSGICFTAAIALINISVQMRAPNWVNARALSAFQSLIAGGAAVGAWLWGSTASQFDLSTAFFMSALIFLLSIFMRFTNPITGVPEKPEKLSIDVVYRYSSDFLPLTAGPIIVELHYRIAPNVEIEFLSLMKRTESVRLRNGARSWSLSRDVDDPVHWIQRYICPTWRDLLHLRERRDHEERVLLEKISKLQIGGGPPEIRIRVDTDMSNISID